MPKPRFCKRCGSVNIELIGDLIKCPDCGNLGIIDSNCQLVDNPETKSQLFFLLTAEKSKKLFSDIVLFGIHKIYTG